MVCTLRIKAGGKITDVTIDKQMMSDVRLASRRRIEYLDAKRQQKSDEEQEADRKKRKAATIKELEAKKRKVDEEAKKVIRSIDMNFGRLGGKMLFGKIDCAFF